MWPFTTNKKATKPKDPSDDLFSGMSVKQVDVKADNKKNAEGFDFIDQKEIDVDSKDEPQIPPAQTPKTTLNKETPKVTASLIVTSKNIEPIAEIKIEKKQEKAKDEKVTTKPIENNSKDIAANTPQADEVIATPIAMPNPPIIPSKKTSPLDPLKDLLEKSKEIKSIKELINSEIKKNLQSLINIIDSIYTMKKKENDLNDEKVQLIEQLNRFTEQIQTLTTQEKYLEADNEESKRKEVDDHKVKVESQIRTINRDIHEAEMIKADTMKKLCEYTQSAVSLSTDEIKLKTKYIENREQEERQFQSEREASIISKTESINSAKESLEKKKGEVAKKEEEFKSMIELMTESFQNKKKIKEGLIKGKLLTRTQCRNTKTAGADR